MTSDEHQPAGQFGRLLGAFVLPAVAAAVGGAVTAPSIRSWYPTLRKPPFNPPNWIFGPVWTTLYFLMGLADYLVARQGTGRQDALAARRVYRLQLLLNTVWSFLFFGARAPGVALVEVVLLWLAILWTILAFARISKPAALLLVPYLAWVSFATVLNGEIWRRNSGRVS